MNFSFNVFSSDDNQQQSQFQTQSYQGVNVQSLQKTTLDIHDMETQLILVDRYVKAIKLMIQSPSKNQKHKCESLNVGVVSSIDALGYTIQKIREKRDLRSLKLMENQFVKYWKKFHNSNHHHKVVECILPLLKYIVLAFQGKQLPKLPQVEFPEEDFNEELVNRSVNNLQQAKKQVNDLEENVKINSMLFYEKYLKELNDEDTDKTHKFIQNMKINENEVNVNSLYKHGNNHYKFKKNNDYDDNIKYNGAPNIQDPDYKENNDYNVDSYIDLKSLKEGDKVDYRCDNGKYKTCEVKKVDKKKNEIKLKDFTWSETIKSANKHKLRCIFKEGSMTNRNPQVWFNHYYFSNNYKWSRGSIIGYDKGYVKIETDLNDPKRIFIQVNDHRYIRFDLHEDPNKNINKNNKKTHVSSKDENNDSTMTDRQTKKKNNTYKNNNNNNNTRTMDTEDDGDSFMYGL